MTNTEQYRYTIKREGFTDFVLPTLSEPIGWKDVKLNLGRTDNHGVNIEYMDSVSFSGLTRDAILSIFQSESVNSDASFYVEILNNETQIYEYFKEYSFDFSSISNDISGDKASRLTVKLIDKGIRVLLESKSSVEYDCALPTENKSILSYTGVKLVAENVLQIGEEEFEMQNEALSKDWFFPKSTRAIGNYSGNISFVDSDDTYFDTPQFWALRACTVSMQLRIKATINKEGTFSLFPPVSWLPPIGRFQLMRYTTDNSGYNLIEEIARIEPNSYRTEGETFREEYYDCSASLTANMNPNDRIGLFYFTEFYDGVWNLQYASLPAPRVGSSFDTYLRIMDVTASAYNGIEIECVTPKWCLEQVINKILGITSNNSNYTLNWNLNANFKGDFNYYDLITSSDGLKEGLTDRKIILSYDFVTKMIKSWGCFIDFNGNTVTVDRVEEAYKLEKADYQINGISDISWAFDKKHVFTSIEVGSDVSDNDKINGKYAFCCKNNFTTNVKKLEGSTDKKITLVDGTIKDCFSIEDYLRLSRTSDADNRTDNRIFMFACKLVNGIYELNRDYKIASSSSTLPFPDAMSLYNVPYTPKRQMLCNQRLLSVSNYIISGKFNFTSTNKLADLTTQMTWEALPIVENAAMDMAEPLFLPQTINCKGVIPAEELNKLEKYSQYEIADGIVGYIEDIEIGCGMDRSTTLKFKAKTIEL